MPSVDFWWASLACWANAEAVSFSVIWMAIALLAAAFHCRVEDFSHVKINKLFIWK